MTAFILHTRSNSMPNCMNTPHIAGYMRPKMVGIQAMVFNKPLLPN